MQPCQAHHARNSSARVTHGLLCKNFPDVRAYVLQMVIVIMKVPTEVSHGLSCRNFLDVGAYALQTVIVIMHLSRAGVDSNALSVIVAIQVLLLWIKVQYYARQAPHGTMQLLIFTFLRMRLPLLLSVAKMSLVSSILQACSGCLSLASARVISLLGEGSTQVMQALATPSMLCLPPKADRENVCNSVCKVQGAAAHKESLRGHPKGGAG